ncbi:N-acyl-D-amino-acid deacylase family protein [Sphingobacterium faecale]|uniref:D-aminoacylase n=1 Tax=Sphingobacterium faecale TaxID=2803775 RepID=A0ABS1R0K2_9SPHI|nr:D-aminoacylase [Sphingobacterium faecale]MBL1407426.1 D-aminoacylase [Sphingobacterium faecale]
MIGRIFSIVCLILFSVFVSRAQRTDKLDVLIKNAWVFDGTGSDSVQLDVGICKDRILFVGKEEGLKAKRVIDAVGLYLAPGFIDPHTHHNGSLMSEDAGKRAVLRVLKQGVTTIFMGNDGSGPMPIGETLEQWQQDGIGVNAALFVPHGTVRTKVIGFRNIEASDAQIEQMKVLVEQGMKEGAFGLSTGLFYTPGFFSSTDEVIELSKVAAAYGGIYDTHQRDEGQQSVGVINSVKEVLEIGEKANIPVHISHIKVLGTPSWGKSLEIIRMVEEAQKKGIKATANQYPYVASRTSLSAAVVPPWVRDGGLSAMKKHFHDPSLRDSILRGIGEMIRVRTGTAEKLLLSIPSDPFLDNKSIAEVAKIWNISPEAAVLEILKDRSPSVHSFSMTEEDLLNFMREPWVMVGSDGGDGHPRAFGTFPRLIRRYAIDKNVLSLAQAIHKSSGLTAKTLHIRDRGFIREGHYADIVLFDPKTIADKAVFGKTEQLATGIEYVWVNGKLTIDRGEYTKALAGRTLRLNQDLKKDKKKYTQN